MEAEYGGSPWASAGSIVELALNTYLGSAGVSPVDDGLAAARDFAVVGEPRAEVGIVGDRELRIIRRQPIKYEIRPRVRQFCPPGARFASLYRRGLRQMPVRRYAR